RFPSGPWTGFFLQRLVPGRHLMELDLAFRGGVLSGSGRDWVGTFALQGRYELADGHCSFMKSYIGKHAVSYQGYNEGKGIWGTWTTNLAGYLPPRGGFHLWPGEMSAPSHPKRSKHADLPVSEREGVMIDEPQLIPI